MGNIVSFFATPTRVEILEIPDADGVRKQAVAQEAVDFQRAVDKGLNVFYHSLAKMERGDVKIVTEHVYFNRSAASCGVWIIGTWKDFEDVIVPQLEAKKFIVIPDIRNSREYQIKLFV